jgi:hypothetical protein
VEQLVVIVVVVVVVVAAVTAGVPPLMMSMCRNYLAFALQVPAHHLDRNLAARRPPRVRLEWHNDDRELMFWRARTLRI